MLLSIITINYNNREGLERTARSIVEQTCQDYEWIVIDGGSTDGSVDVIRRYADHIAYWISESDRGIYHAMNKGVDRATGDYLHMLNSGDYYHDKNVISDFISQKFDADVVHGAIQVVDKDCNPQYIFSLNKTVDEKFFIGHNFCQQAIFYSRRCFENHTFDESYKICADLKFNIELFFRGCTFLYWDRILVNYDNTGISSVERPKYRPEGIRAQAEAFPPETLAQVCRYYRYEMLDCKEIITRYDNDIYQKTSVLIRGPKILRHILRLILYPLSYFASVFSRQTSRQR